MVEEEAVLAVTGDFGQETRFGGSIGVFGQEGHHFGGGRGDLVAEAGLMVEGDILVVEKMEGQRIGNKI